jgi:5-methylcytosine-specific restriction endonuclease McrA
MTWPIRLKRGPKVTQRHPVQAPVAATIALSVLVDGQAEIAKAGARATGYSCRYCKRGDGVQTRDHKIPKVFGGKGLVDNIVRCCQMCNSIKGARHYGKFVALFGLFLEEHGAGYRAANPDDWDMVGVMACKFNAWLDTLHHGPPLAGERAA